MLANKREKLYSFAYLIISPIIGRKYLQKFFEILNLFSLIGMNIGNGADASKSGELFVLNYINKYLDKLSEIVVFDVGANNGQYSLLVKKIFGKRLLLHVFEPSEKTYKKLILNLRKYKKVIFNKCGLGEMNQKVILYSDSDLSALASVYKRKIDYLNINMKKSEYVNIRSLDDYCKEKNINHIHFLKLDVEGHEMKVLKGGTKMLNLGLIDFIQFEFGGCNIDSKTYFQDFYYLLRRNYKIYRVLRDGLYQIKRYRPMHEAFYVTNYLAVKKR